MTDNRARVPLDDIQSYNVLIGPQRNSVLEERSKPKPLDPESIERRVQRSRRTIQAIRDKAKIAAETHAQAQITEIEATVTQEKDKRLFTITKRKEEALLKLHQIFAKEQALIETTFHMRLTEHELLAQQWTTQAEKIAFERRIQEQEKDEKHEKHKMTRQMTLAEQMLQEQADNLQSAKLNELKEAEDDPLRILGLRTRTPGEDSAAPFLATAVPPFGASPPQGFAPAEAHAGGEEERQAGAQEGPRSESAENVDEGPTLEPVKRRAHGARVGARAITLPNSDEIGKKTERRTDRLNL